MYADYVLMVMIHKRPCAHAPCPLDRRHSIGLRPHVHFRFFGPQLGLRPRSRPAASIFGPSGLNLAGLQRGLRPRYRVGYALLRSR